MKKTHLASSAALLLMAAVASGCGTDHGAMAGGGGTGGTGGGTGDGGSRVAVYADDAGTAAQALAGGETLKTDGFTSSARAGNQPLDATFAVEKNDDGAVDVTINGETYAFSAADNAGDGGWEKGENYVGAWTYPDADDSFDPDEPSGRYSQVWGYFLEDSDGQAFNGFSVVGAETKPEALENQASATYDGGMLARFRRTDGTNRETEVRTGPDGGLTMNADFDQATISGQADGFVRRDRVVGGDWGDTESFNGTITMEETAIDGNAYNGQIESTGDFQANLSGDATYSGRFYGPDAEEAAGTIGYSGDPNATGVGFFEAKKR